MFVLVYSRDGQQQRHTLPAGDTIVGRAPVCDLTIDDPSISRRHAQFTVYGERCQLRDLGGRNGTFLNGVLVTEADVHVGDTVVLGRFPMTVERAADRHVELSDRHSLIEAPGTVCRPMKAAGATGIRSSVEPERLLGLPTEISRRLVRWQPLEEILEHVVSVVFEIVPVERAFLLLLDERTGTVGTRVARRRDGQCIEGTTLSRTVIRKALDERLAMLANDARLDPRLAAAESLYAATFDRSSACRCGATPR